MLPLCYLLKFPVTFFFVTIDMTGFTSVTTLIFSLLPFLYCEVY